MALLILVGLVSWVAYELNPPPTMYACSFRINVGLEHVPDPQSQYEDNPLDTWVASEYLMDDLATAVRGAAFAERVAQQLGEENVNLAGKIGASTEYRALTVSILWHDDAQLARIANAAVAVLNRDAAELVGPLGDSHPVLPLIDPPVVVPVGRSLKEKLDIPIRLGLALVAGVAGTFLLEYLDTTIRGRTDLEEFEIPVLSEIPHYKHR